jgi:hypothetical protein
MSTIAYWKRVLEDAVTAFATGFLSVVGADVLDVLTFDWGKGLSVGLGASVLFVLKSLATKNAGDPNVPQASGSKPEDNVVRHAN